MQLRYILPVVAIAFVACKEEVNVPKISVELWTSPEGTVSLDYPQNQEVACDSIRLWLDDMKSMQVEEDNSTSCRANLVFYDKDYITYEYTVQTLATEYFEGDISTRNYTYRRTDGHLTSPYELIPDTARLIDLVLRYATIENEWIIDAIGGGEALQVTLDVCSVGVLARGIALQYPVMEGLYQNVCVIPSSELVFEERAQ